MSVEISLKGLERQIKNLSRMDMKSIGFEALKLNNDQIKRKKNRDGTRFKPYSHSYANRKGVGINAVDLVSKASAVSDKSKPYGTMLKSFTVVSMTRYSVTVGFLGTWEKSKAGFTVSGSRNKSKGRPFVGLTKKNRRKLNKFAFKKISQGTF
jgi:hypothetical protein